MLVSKPSTPLAIVRRSPCLTRLCFDARTPVRTHLVQSIHHDPTIAGKMYNPITGKAKKIDSLLRGPDSTIWLKSLSNEWGQCTQGLHKSCSVNDTILGNNTVVSIFLDQVPAGRKVTYAIFVCTMQPGKAEVFQMRMVVGGDCLDAYQDVRSPAVGVVNTKLHLNSVISDAHLGARYCTGDLKDFFLVSNMPIYQYMRVHCRYVPQEIINEYDLTNQHFSSKGFVYLEIRKCMYGLKEAAILAYDQLKAHLAPYGYFPVAQTPGLWRHTN
jgi:hypothetical protein